METGGDVLKFICFILLTFLLLSGCGDGESNETNAKPDRIPLTFNPLQMDELQHEEASTDWEMIKSLPFGHVESNEAILEIYKVKSRDENLHSQLNGVLKIKEMQFQIPDLSYSLIENDNVKCPQVCLFQRLFSNQKQFELLGSIELFSNGPGLKMYVVYDVLNNKLISFNSWGEPIFIDLDNDGNDEFIIEFQGLHLSWPDISFIRANKGLLEVSTSVFSTTQKNQGDFAKLTLENNPPTISISNIQSENEPIYIYTYHDGVLDKRSSTNSYNNEL